MLSLIQTLCRLHLQHQWELYRELRGKAQRGAIRTQFTKLNDKPRLVTLWRVCQLQILRLPFYTPQIPHFVQTQALQRIVTYRLCPNVSVHTPQAKICNILQMTFDSTHSFSIPTRLFVHCSVLEKNDSVGGGALKHVLIVSFRKWSPDLVSSVCVWSPGVVECLELRFLFFPTQTWYPSFFCHTYNFNYNKTIII